MSDIEKKENYNIVCVDSRDPKSPRLLKCNAFQWIVSAEDVIQSPREGPYLDLYRSSQRVIRQARQSVVMRKRS